MKIISASVEAEDVGYRAEVNLLDEGVRYCGKAAPRNDPREAVNAAFSDAVRQITVTLRESLKVRQLVEF